MYVNVCKFLKQMCFLPNYICLTALITSYFSDFSCSFVLLCYEKIIPLHFNKHFKSHLGLVENGLSKKLQTDTFMVERILKYY